MTKLKWNSVGERLFEAGVDRGVLYTKDVGAPPAPVAVGAPSATKPMLLPLRQWGVEQALWLPGAAGNYASIPDTNVLSADAAHTRDSGSASDHGWGSTGASTRVVDPLHAFFGQTSIKATSSGSGSVGFFAGSTAVGPGGARPAVTPGTTYTASAYLYVEDDPGVQFKLSIEWRNSAGTLVGVASGAVENLIIDGWTHLSATGVPPATATYGVITIYSQSTPAAGKILWLSAVCFRTGSDPTFVPSTRIVGDLDVRWFGALADWTPAAESILLSKYTSGAVSWSLRVAPTGKPTFNWSVDGTTLAAGDKVASVSTGAIDGTRRWCRAILDVNNGAAGNDVKFYTSEDYEDSAGLQLGTTLTTAGVTSIASTSARVEVGTRTAGSTWPAKGAVLAFEIRDGIDGPIVASANFTNPTEVDGDIWTTPEGHTGTINRSGNGTAELVDRNVWTFPNNAAEYLDINDSDGMDPDTNSITLVSKILTRTTIGYAALWDGGYYAGNVPSLEFYITRVSGKSGSDIFVRDGSVVDNVRKVPSVSIANGSHHTVFAGIDAAAGHLFAGDETGKTSEAKSLVGSNISNTRVKRIGNRQVTATTYSGLMSIFLNFSRVLSDNHLSDLAEWDGSVANEPKWLRDDPDLVLYLNADADETVEAYEDDVVVSLHGLKPWYPDFHGIPWNGLVAVNERTVGGEVTPYYIDGIKYLNEASNEDFEATIEAFTYPEEFMQYEGIQEVHNGLFATLQGKRSFGLSYRTLVGNDLEGTDHAYKIHIIYNATVVPADRNRSSLGGSIDPTNFAWTIVTKPDDFTGYKQTAHFVIDSREIPTQLLKDLEDILYGTDTTDPRLPSATELISMFETGSVEELYDIWDAGELGESVDATIDGGEL